MEHFAWTCWHSALTSCSDGRTSDSHSSIPQRHKRTVRQAELDRQLSHLLLCSGLQPLARSRSLTSLTTIGGSLGYASCMGKCDIDSWPRMRHTRESLVWIDVLHDEPEQSYLSLHSQQDSPTNKVFSTIDHQDAPCQSITSGANTGVNNLLDTWLGSSGVVFGAGTVVSSEAAGPWKWACKDTGTSTQKTMQSAASS